MTILSKILFSKIGLAIFRMLIKSVDMDIPLREMEKRLGIPAETLRAELKKLTDLNLVTRMREGGRTSFRINTAHPSFPHIRKVVLKTINLAGTLKTIRKR